MKSPLPLLNHILLAGTVFTGVFIQRWATDSSSPSPACGNLAASVCFTGARSTRHTHQDSQIAAPSHASALASAQELANQAAKGVEEPVSVFSAPSSFLVFFDTCEVLLRIYVLMPVVLLQHWQQLFLSNGLGEASLRHTCLVFPLLAQTFRTVAALPRSRRDTQTMLAMDASSHLPDWARSRNPSHPMPRANKL
ncbi:hypothetical protein J3F83DRAFT_752824 [Trichoderma novae-zelandiae]